MYNGSSEHQGKYLCSAYIYDGKLFISIYISTVVKYLSTVGSENTRESTWDTRREAAPACPHVPETPAKLAKTLKSQPQAHFV